MVSKTNWEEVYAEKGYFIKYPDEDLIRFMAKNFYTRPLSERKGIRVLDFGSGCGRNSIYLAKEGFTPYALEITNFGVSLSKEQAKKESVKINFIESNITNANIQDGFFDAVIDIQSAQHNKLKEIIAIISRIYKLLKNDGLFFSKMVSTEDCSYGTGRKVEENTFTDIPDGPFTNLGVSHFFSLDEINGLFSNFSDVSIESYERTFANRAKKVKYWIVTAKK